MLVSAGSTSTAATSPCASSRSRRGGVVVLGDPAGQCDIVRGADVAPHAGDWARRARDGERLVDAAVVAIAVHEDLRCGRLMEAGQAGARSGWRGRRRSSSSTTAGRRRSASSWATQGASGVGITASWHRRARRCRRAPRSTVAGGDALPSRRCRRGRSRRTRARRWLRHPGEGTYLHLFPFIDHHRRPTSTGCCGELRRRRASSTSTSGAAERTRRGRLGRRGQSSPEGDRPPTGWKPIA